MPIKQSIAAKIFGLALLLLLLTIGLAGYLLVEATRTARAMNVVVKEYLPLADSITRINEYGLRRRLAFERWFGALNGEHPNAEVVAEASANYKIFTEHLTKEFATARGFLKSGYFGADGSAAMSEVRQLFEQVEAAYPAMSKRQVHILELQQAREHARANELLNFLNDQQRSMLEHRARLRIKIDALTQAAGDDVSQRQARLLWLTIMATLSTVLLGLLVAGIITGRLTRPVRSLATAMRDVQAGNLELQLPVLSSDEVGALTSAFNYFVREMRTKEQIKSTFGKYIDPRVLEQVLQQPEKTHFEVERRVMTVMFADLVGFTSLSERLTPSLIVALLNRHFELQAAAVQAHGGVVDKFIGDAVMSFWGPPFVKEEEHALLACRSALAQRAAIEQLRRELPEITGLRKDAPVIDLRLGICSGDLVVGNIGGENTRSYTVIGDTVNLASRIEGLNRIYGTQMLLGAATARAVGTLFELREIDEVAVKGKGDSERIYELLGVAGSVPAKLLDVCERYRKALAAYRSADWDTAAQLFEECAQLGDQPSQLMLTRIGALRFRTLNAEWDGIWRLDEK